MEISRGRQWGSHSRLIFCTVEPPGLGVKISQGDFVVNFWLKPKPPDPYPAEFTCFSTVARGSPLQRWSDEGVVDNALEGSCENIGNITSKQSFAKMARPRHCKNIILRLRKAWKLVVAGNGAAIRG